VNKWFEIKEDVTLAVVDTQLIFRPQVTQTPHFTMNQSGTLARKLLMNALSSEEDAFLEALSGPDKGTRLALHDGIQQVEIGGAMGRFNFPPMTPAVVATIVRDGDGFLILPKEAVFINGIPTSTKSRLSHSTEIEMGKIRFVFTDPLEAHFLEINDGLESEVKIDAGSMEIPILNASTGKSEVPNIERDSAMILPPEERKPKAKKDGLLVVVFLVVVLIGIAVVFAVLSL
jgi:hypothetical protein